MSERKSFLDSLSESKPESFQQETFVPVSGNKKMYFILGTVAVLAIALLAGFKVYENTQKVIVEALVGQPLSEAAVWARRNDIVLVTRGGYSTEFQESIILSQDTPYGDVVMKKDSITIEVSMGPDPDELIEVPDLKSMSIEEIQEWADQQQLAGLRFTTAHSETVPADQVIGYTFLDGGEATFRRKNRVSIEISLGPEDVSDLVTVPNFFTMRISEILEWSRAHGVPLEIVNVFDEYVSAGSVVSQSTKPQTEMEPSQGIAVGISMGQSVSVPDFGLMTKAEIDGWSKPVQVDIYSSQCYSDQVPKGQVIQQRPAAGEMIRQGDDIQLVFSLGRVEIPSHLGQTRLDVLRWQDDLNSQGAGLTVVFGEDYGTRGSAGKVIQQSIVNDQVEIGATLEVTLSLGMIMATPDFSGMNEHEITRLANELGLWVQYTYQNSTVVNRGYIISQIPRSGAPVTDQDKITVTISMSDVANPKLVVADFLSMKANEILAWGVHNDVHIDLYKVPHSFVAAGSVVSQSVRQGTLVDPGTLISVAISSGDQPQIKSTQVPDFSTLSESQANEWARQAGVSLIVLRRHSDVHARDIFYHQSVPTGSFVHQNDVLTLSQSLGRLTVPSFVGKTKLDVFAWQEDVNARGASVAVTFNEVYGPAGSAGKVLSQSPINDVIPLNATVEFDVSKGLMTVVPSFLGSTKADAEASALEIGLNVLFAYAHSSVVDEGRCISQSLDPGEITTDNVTIYIVVSLGPAPPN